MIETFTIRGFALIDFIDAYEKPCSIQASSAINEEQEGGFENPGSSYLWVGRDDVTDARMHITREQAGRIAEFLKRWSETGELHSPVPEE